MARTFNGTSDQVVCSLGACNVGYGTWAAIIQRASGASGSDSIFNVRDGTGAANRILMGAATTTSAFEARFASTITAPTITIPASSGWIFLAAAKATGSSAIRFFKYVYSTDTWTIEDGSAASDSSTAATAVHLGHRNSDQRWQGDIAVTGLFNRKLTDGEVSGCAFSIAHWLSLAPVGMWVLDQAATSQLIPDWTGNGANESTLTGTSVATSSVPMLGYGAVVLEPGVATGAATTESGTISASGSLAATERVTEAGTVVAAGTLTALEVETELGALVVVSVLSASETWQAGEEQESGTIVAVVVLVGGTHQRARPTADVTDGTWEAVFV